LSRQKKKKKREERLKVNVLYRPGTQRNGKWKMDFPFQQRSISYKNFPCVNAKRGIQSITNGSEFVNGVKSEQINDGIEKTE
jgi:hypothetical protein